MAAEPLQLDRWNDADEAKWQEMQRQMVAMGERRAQHVAALSSKLTEFLREVGPRDLGLDQETALVAAIIKNRKGIVRILGTFSINI